MSSKSFAAHLPILWPCCDSFRYKWANYFGHQQRSRENCSVTDIKELNSPNEGGLERNQKSYIGPPRIIVPFSHFPLNDVFHISRAPVSAPLLGGPPISASSHVVSSASGQSKTVPPPPPPPPHAPKTAQLSQPHHHPPAPPPPRRRTRPPTPSSSTVVAASERIDDYRDVRVILVQYLVNLTRSMIRMLLSTFKHRKSSKISRKYRVQ